MGEFHSTVERVTLIPVDQWCIKLWGKTFKYQIKDNFEVSDSELQMQAEQGYILPHSPL